MKLPVLPADRYPFAEATGEEGDRCTTCYYLRERKEKGTTGYRCANKWYVRAAIPGAEKGTVVKKAGSDWLPDDPSRWCCMVWSGKKR